MRPDVVVVTSEHASNAVPAEWAARFTGDRAILATHRAYDAGVAALSRDIAARIEAPRFAGEATRLLVDLNRSESHPRLVSDQFDFDRAERDAVVTRWWRPYRDAVQRAIRDQVAAGRSVLHLSVHSFTPVLDGVVRTTDVGLLYDPRRAFEKAFCARWKVALERHTDRVVHRNAPYKGVSDGLTTELRKVFPDASYAGVELEVNQRFVADSRVEPALADAIVASLVDALGLDTRPGPG